MSDKSPFTVFSVPLIIGILVVVVGFYIDASLENKRNSLSDVTIPVKFKEVELLQSTIKLPVSALPGYNLALQKCTICHSADYIHHQPPGMDQKSWTSEVLKMKQSYGAPISESDVKSIGAYLSVVYGTAKADDAEIIKASKQPLNTPITDDVIDVQALLSQNTCTGCHSIDQKIVGPAFQSIAKKYQTDTDSIKKVALSIQNGGSGKWGSTPMPPMSNVSDKQAEALAKFILDQ